MIFGPFAWTGSRAEAQVIPSSERAGRERDRFVEPQAPAAQPSGDTVSLSGTVAPPGAENVTLILSDVQIAGSTIYRPDDFAWTFVRLIGTQITLRDVYDIAQKITGMYGRDGYVLSRAIVPPQNLRQRAGTVQIQIVEGYIDEVEWPRQKLARYQDFFSTYEARILADRPANVRTLERYLLLANDLPGLRFTTSLKPSPRARNASTLVVDVAEKPIDAEVRIDNRGTEARGPIQFLSSVSFNNLLGAHEMFNVTWAGTAQLKELSYFAFGAKKVLSPEGLTVFANASTGFGKPGTAMLELLQFKTRSTSFELGATYPVVRTREKNVSATALMFATDSTSDILGTRFNEDRLRGIRVRLDADFADRLQGINQLNVILSHGFDGLGSTQNGNIFASRAAGRVDFTKIEAQFARLQPLGAGFSVFGSLYGQTTTDPLLAPEQCGYGDRFFGRAFDPSELLGDRCLLASGELRYDLAVPVPVVQRVQLYGFADHGSLWTSSPAAGTPASQNGASIGAGTRMNWLTYFNTDLTVAKAVSGPRDDTRFFFAAGAKY